MVMSSYSEVARFIHTQARPLEAALFSLAFENGERTPAIHHLAAFQNDDGGFGHGLEPDMRLPGSSVIATTIAFQHFRTLGLTDADPMVQRASAYLVATFDAERSSWPIMPPNVDDAPHAPWWQYGGGLSQSPANPTAEILGFLHEFPAGFRDDLREQVRAHMLAYLTQIEGKADMHEMICFVALLENPAISEAFRADILPLVIALAKATVERDPAGWQAYGLPPLALIQDSHSALARTFADVLPANLDDMTSQRTPGGGWLPNWDWGHSPEVWALAKRDWTGVQTLTNLKKLRAFGRL